MPPRPRRSCLTVPASSLRMLEKAAALEVDEVVVDLEDGTAAADKEAARANLAAAGARGTLAVRINGVGTPWWRDDLAAVRRRQPAVVVLPKAESAGRGRGRRRAPAGRCRARGADRDRPRPRRGGADRGARRAARGARLRAGRLRSVDRRAHADDRRGVLRLRARPHRRRRPGVRPPARRRPLRNARRREPGCGHPPSARSRSAATASG